MRTRASLALCLVAATLLAPLARAQSTATRVIVLTFEGGRRGAAAREAALAELAPYVELVTEEQAIAAAQSMSIDVSTPEGLGEVVRALGVTLVVTGAVTGQGRRAQTELVVVDATGAELARVEAPAPGNAAARAEIGRAAVGAIDAANAALAERARGPTADAQSPDPDASGPAPITYDDDVPRRAEPSGRWRHPLALALVGLRLRTVAASVDEVATNTRFFFAADMYPEIELVTWFRPLTDADDPAARGLVLGVRGAVSAGIRYVDEAAGDERAMTSYRLRVDAGYGYTIDDLVELQGVVGFGLDGVDLEMPTGFASLLYAYLRPALNVRVALYRALFVLDGGIGGRIGLDGGPLAGAFGPGMSFGGVDLSIGFSGVVEPGLAWAARFGYAFHALSFDGSGGTLGMGAQGSDETFELRLLLGWAF
ncbi:MAG: hypothetical protein KF729_03530 [Sandaracinaceae bacterium]|nr:hypothetical protein [Sandaracinaceae bacterium]